MFMLKPRRCFAQYQLLRQRRFRATFDAARVARFFAHTPRRSPRRRYYVAAAMPYGAALMPLRCFISSLPRCRLIDATPLFTAPPFANIATLMPSRRRIARCFDFLFAA